ncbi:MAG: hypothetical protein C3F11_00185, partial [Methylocystaceae bacterium]
LSLAFLTIASSIGVTSAVAFDTTQRFVIAQAAEKASGEGVIKGVDASERKLLIAHGPIPALKWPSMTMAFGVAPNIDFAALPPGVKVKFTLSRDAKGLYVVEQIHRAE